MLICDTGKFFLAVANCSAPKTRHAFQILLSVVIANIDAIGTLQYNRSMLLMLSQICRGMQQVLQIHSLNRIVRILVMGCESWNISHVISPCRDAARHQDLRDQISVCALNENSSITESA